MGDKAGGSKRSQSTDNKIQSGRHNQKSDQEKEESLFSDRDGWWRTTFKEVDVPPWHYNLIPGPVIKMPSKHVMFRSAVQRFPTIYFRPKEGPAPGHYELKGDVQHAIKSSFQSRVPRFLPIRNQKTPGPGTYEIARY
ncbi:protein STPG4 isoform X2 [Protopterus annectens]|uniref:protein STPG4 isoform X2 n=1 Tax=Protopterus annectens TaxID=7888 RepID=UPI001CF93877|nr:protein STPG4 isoform X2 [Protopterus annectens]